MPKTQRELAWMLYLCFGCDPKVVDAVRDPLPVMSSEPAGSGGSAGTGTEVGEAGSEAGGTQPTPLQTSLLHRYSFDGSGALAVDSRGAAHGQIVGAKLAGTGSLALAGERTGQYVNLPNGMVSGLVNATFEAWLTWQGGALWQRIFDFGSSNGGEDPTAKSLGTTYLFLTPNSGSDSERKLSPGLHAAYSQSGIDDEEVCNTEEALPAGVLTHVALVVDHDGGTFSVYRDGALLKTCPLTRPLSAIDDVNDWLGRSNFSADAELAGSYEEFRLYSVALSAEQVKNSFAAGPDAAR